MSVKIFKYLLVVFLFLSVLIIGSNSVIGACYIKQLSCDPETACLGTDLDCYTKTFMGDDTCSTGSAGTCEEGCCCILGSPTISLKGYCDGKGVTNFNPTIKTDAADECKTYCSGAVGQRYNITGYIKIDNVAVPNAQVTLDRTIVIYTDVDGRYNFIDISKGSHLLTATSGSCVTPTEKSVSLFQNEAVDITLTCPSVTVSGKIIDESGAIQPIASVDAFYNQQHHPINSDYSGIYTFNNVPQNALVTITASNNAGCSGSLDLTTTSQNSVGKDITLTCGTYTIRGNIENMATPITEVYITANPIGKKVLADTGGQFTITGLNAGPLELTARKVVTTPITGGSSETTCTNTVGVTIINTVTAVTIPLGTDKCCVKTSTKTQCVNNRYTETTSYTGTGSACIGMRGETITSSCGDSSPPCKYYCNANGWSGCTNGATREYCTNPILNTTSCDQSLTPVPLDDRPCGVSSCGNGSRESTEACDWTPYSFFIRDDCKNRWKSNLAAIGTVVTDQDIDASYQLKLLMCNAATCGCMENPGTVTNPTICKPASASILSITPITASPNMTINWSVTPPNPCDAFVNHFELGWCIKSLTGECTYMPVNPNSPDINSRLRSYTHTVNPYQDKTEYCYKLTTVFNDSVAPENRILNSTKCINTSVSNCVFRYPNSWCDGNTRFTCRQDNTLNSTVCPSGSTCTIVSGVATCVAQAACDVCNGPFGLFGYQGYTNLYVMIGQDKRNVLCPSLVTRAPRNPAYDEIGGCYMDYTNTTVDKSYSCNNTVSCYDYYSELSCESDHCKKFTENGVNQCEWQPLTTFSSAFNVFNKGVCRPKNESKQQCELCNAGIGKNNRLEYKECSASTCSIYGACYFDSVSKECISKSNLKCTTYKDINECIGGENGRNVTTNVDWDFNTNQKIRGNNVRTNSSDGGIPVGLLGVCKWTTDTNIRNNMRTSGCFRDADNNVNARDCLIPRDISNVTYLSNLCEHDTTPPTTRIVNKPVYGLLLNLTDQIIITDNNPWGLGDETRYCGSPVDYCPYILLKYCVVDRSMDSQSSCYPNNILDTTRNPYIINLSRFPNARGNAISIADTGKTFAVYYFSEDPAKNLETPIKSFTFIADTTPPSVEITPDMTSYRVSDISWLTNVSFRLRLTSQETDPVTCSLIVTPKGDAELSFRLYHKERYNIPTAFNPSANKLTATVTLNTTYPALVDGRYSYQVDCYDHIGNLFTTGPVDFSITGNVLMNNPTPSYEIFRSSDLPGGTATISIDTSVEGTCSYATSSAYQDLREFSNTNSGTHSAEVSIPQSGSGLYQTGVYRYYTVCDLSFNDKMYTVYGNDVINPVFSIDDLAPITVIKINGGTTSGWRTYNPEDSDYISYAEIQLKCNDSNPSLEMKNEQMYFGCVPTDPTWYCIEQVSNGFNCGPGDYVPYTDNIKFDYRNGRTADKETYGKNPVLHYYSTDNGGNGGPNDAKTLTLRIKNMDLNEPSASAYLGDSQQTVQLIAASTNINSSQVTITVKYPFETDVSIVSYNLRYYPNPSNKNIYVDSSPEIVDGATNGKAEYSFFIPYADNGAYTLNIKTVDDDDNSNDYNVSFTVKHDNNIIRLVSPKVGIGSRPQYEIELATTYASECKHSMYGLESYGDNIGIRFNDPEYVALTPSAQNTRHTFTHNGASGKMYIICKTTGTLFEDMDNRAYVNSSFNVGYNTSAPTINVSFIQKPLTRPNDNRILNSSYNATILNITTDQPSVCQISSSNPQSLPLSVRIDPPKTFAGEDYNVYNKYNLTHQYLISYIGTSATPRPYDYIIRCTSLAQLDNTASTTVDFLPFSAPPIMHVTVSRSTFDYMWLNVTCSGLCMESSSEKYYYTLAKANESCDQLPDTRYKTPTTTKSYSQLIEIDNTTMVCVRGFDLLGRTGTTNYSVVLSSDNGVMNIVTPFGYRPLPSSTYDKVIYSPTKTFTLGISTEIGTECRYALAETLTLGNDASAIYNQMTNKFTTEPIVPFELRTHTATINILAESQVMEVLEVVCYESNSLPTAGNSAYVRRELQMYWDDTAPQILMNVTPPRINDWMKRDKVSFSINTTDKSMCILDLESSTITNNNNGNKESLNYLLDSVALDSGSEDVFNSYIDYRNYTYSLPSKWLSDINFNATYEFNVKCTNRAKLESTEIRRVLYDLDKTVVITVGSKNIITGNSIPINFTTNVNSVCSVKINDITPSVSVQTTSTDGLHHTAILSSSTQNLTGIHTVIIECGVPTNGNIVKGVKEYTVILDATPPIVTLSTINDVDYVCNLNGFDINVNLADDTGITGYYYTITGTGVDLSYGQMQSGVLDNEIQYLNGKTIRTGSIHYPLTLVENQKYTIKVLATDLAGRNSTWSTIFVTAKTPTGSIDCDGSAPEGAITLVPTIFRDRIKAIVTCTDDIGCEENYKYSFTSKSNCSSESYLSTEVLGNELVLNHSGLLCVKVSDAVGRTAKMQQYINISVDMSNPLNIRPTANMKFIAPNVIVTTTPITDISILTDVNAECRYSRTALGNMSSTQSDLFAQYMSFTTSFASTHTITSFNTYDQYKQDVDIICNSTDLATQKISRKTFTIIYTNVEPALAASVTPDFIFDWNERKSLLTIETTPDTTCIITSTDTINTPNKIYLGNHSNADTYKPKYISNLSFESPYTQTGTFEYDVNCSTMSDKSSRTKLYVTYDISSVLEIDIGRTTYNAKNIELKINTTLISDCSLMWNNNYKGSLFKSTSGREHSISLTNLGDGQYTADVTCATKITSINVTKRFIITIDTTVPPNYPPVATITTIPTQFLDAVDANVACSDPDDGCGPIYYYILTNNTNTNCSKEATYTGATSRAIGSSIEVRKDALLCIKVQDDSGQSGYAKQYIDVPMDENNPFNITPIVSNYIQPNVYIARSNPSDIIVTTNIDAHCKYSIYPPPNYATLTEAELYDMHYRDFDVTNTKTHTIQGMMLSGYEQAVDIICYSTALTTAKYSKKTLRVIYNTINPTITAYADPVLIDDWMSRQSYIHIETAPETTCTITTNDVNNEPYQLGKATDATNYSTTYVKKLTYNKNTISDLILYYYDVSCRTLNGNVSTTRVDILYNISRDLTIELRSPQIYNTKNISLEIETNLISDCYLKLDNTVPVMMSKNNVNQKIHSVKLGNVNNGVHNAEFTCTTPVNGFTKTQSYAINVDTSVIIVTNKPPVATITLSNTTFLNVIDANVTCSDPDGECKPIYYYILTNKSNVNCSKEVYPPDNVKAIGSTLQIMKDTALCVKVQDTFNQNGYGKVYVNIPVDPDNPLNITPIWTNYIRPDVYIAYNTPTNVTVTTNYDSQCKYSLYTPPDYETLTDEQLYKIYMNFSVTGQKTHQIYDMVLTGYEQPVSIICYNNALMNTNYSKKTLRVIYNTVAPTVRAYADPEVVYDANYRKSYLHIDTSPETVCSISTDDANNAPYQIGIPTDASTYDTKHAKELLYDKNSLLDIITYYYDISCTTLNGNSTSVEVTVIYNLTKELTIDLISPEVLGTRNITLEIETNLISDCKAKWNNANQTTGMTKNSDQTIHSIKLININSGVYPVEFICTTPVTGYDASQRYNITVNTTLSTPRCGDGLINQASEDCDGNTRSGLNLQTCKSLFDGKKYIGGELACKSDCKYDYAKCDAGDGYCGNDRVEGPNTLDFFEQCDGGKPLDLECEDLGFKGGRLGCTDKCMLNTSRCIDLSASGTTTSPTCNGLLLQSGEHCESFNNTNVICGDFGYYGGTISCNSCTFDLSKCYMDTNNNKGSHRCGDNSVNTATEQCDGTSGMIGITCNKLNFTSGSVTCGKDCKYNVTKCVGFVNNTGNATSLCSNLKKDIKESDIDCGGNCTKCAINKTCSINADCVSGLCKNGRCTLNTCNNSIFDSGLESDLDCGKSCNGCELNKNCTLATDCKSKFCLDNKCAIDPCINDEQDGTESDIDCGGDCEACGIDKACNEDDDCDSGLCKKNICTEPGPESNPIKLPLLIAGIVMILGGGGYIIYKTFIEKPPRGSNVSHMGPYMGSQISTGTSKTQSMPPSMPIALTPEQKETILKQREALAKKRQARSQERKGVIQQLGESSTQNDPNAVMKEIAKGEASKDSGKEKSISKNKEDYVDLSDITGQKEDAKESTFDKLKKIHIDATSKKIAQLPGVTQDNIASTLNNTADLSDTAAIKMFGDMDRDTLMSGVFKEVLSDLLHSKKLTKENASKILFEYMDKGLLNKGDVARISSELKII